MIKKTFVILLGLILIVVAAALLHTPIQNVYWMTAEFLNWRTSQEMKEAWKNKPNEFLLKKIKSGVHMYSGTAESILIERNDKSLYSIYIEMLKSKDKQLVGIAIGGLGNIRDERAVPNLIRIVEKGPENYNYVSALRALAKMKNKEILPQIISLANTKKENTILPQQYAIEMMLNYDDEQIIKILNVFAKDDNYFIRSDAQQALEKIKKGRKSGYQDSKRK